MRASRKRQQRLELFLNEDERATFSKAVDRLISALLAEAPAAESDI
jgi:hypothetical protein